MWWLDLELKISRVFLLPQRTRLHGFVSLKNITWQPKMLQKKWRKEIKNEREPTKQIKNKQTRDYDTKNSNIFTNNNTNQLNSGTHNERLFQQYEWERQLPWQREALWSSFVAITLLQCARGLAPTLICFLTFPYGFTDNSFRLKQSET
jgi:hypothetical protein